MILVDTSAWVEYLRATGSPAHLRLRELVAGEGELATTEVVTMELLAGAAAQEEVAGCAGCSCAASSCRSRGWPTTRPPPSSTAAAGRAARPSAS